MSQSSSGSYKDAGVDIEAGYEAVKLMTGYVKSTYMPSVVSGIGGFGGLVSLKEIKDMEDPIAVSGTDGVGTKLKLAFLLDKHDTVGQDCVAMCVNDIICSGAKPLFFLDYLATGKLVPEKAAQIVKGVADGCIIAGCSLIGGETAEMPGFYKDGEYDMAGFAMGVVDRPKMIDKSRVRVGDRLIGIASSGPHSNGFSLIRKVFDVENANLNFYDENLGSTLGEALLEPTKIYVQPMLKLMNEVQVNGIAHITGGGFYENLPRMLPTEMGVNVYKDSYNVPHIFTLIQNYGNISEKDMYNTFNMGIGMVAIVNEQDASKSIGIIESFGEKAYNIGEVTKEAGQVKILTR